MKTFDPIPPGFFLRFFRWFCHPKLVNHIEGDLLEEYNFNVKELGKRKADLKFMADVVLLIRPNIIKPLGINRNINPYSMYKSYFKIGWRNLLHHKGYSLINIGGLALGMAVAVLIGLWVFDELTFNKYFRNYDGIARVIRNVSTGGEVRSRPYLPNSLGDELRTKYGNSFKQVVMAYPVEEYFLTFEEKVLPLKGEFSEPALTKLLDLKMVRGSHANLNNPHSIFLSESTAEILFGNDDPIGKQLKINNSMEVLVSGVYEDLPLNTHFYEAKFFAPFELLTSYEPWMKELSYTQNFLHIYIQLEDRQEFETVSIRIKDAILNNVRDDDRYAAMNPQIFLQPMQDWHLYPEWKNGVSTQERAQMVWLFGIVGLFVLLLACINFMNLSTARSERRAKEVGVRKSIGSRRTQLMGQFFSESLLVVFLSFIIALIMVTTALSWFNELTGKQISIPVTNPFFWAISIAFIFLTGILAGIYPALYLSSFNVIRVLKGWRSSSSAVLPRKILVVVQFTISTILIIGTAIVYQQIQFTKNRPVGYTRAGLLMLPMNSPDFNGKYELLQTELKNTGAVVEIAESSSPPTEIWSTNGGFDWEGRNPSSEPVFANLTVTPEFGKTVEWQFASGRDFSTELAGDSAAFVINEAAAKEFGFKDPVGKMIQWSTSKSNFSNFKIIGVINDMVMGSPYGRNMPTLYFVGKDGFHHFLNIKISPHANTSEALSKIEGVFRKILPNVPFDFKFVDQEYAQKFITEERIGKLSSVFAVFAIVISCLGLFGLSSFVAEQRTKEIGIRKILGASIAGLWKMLSTEFILLVCISGALAIPFAYYYLNNWLQSFQYRTEISWWVFILAITGTLTITLATVSFQTIKVSLMNPVKSLRTE